MAHGHGHGHKATEISGRRLLIATALNFVITVAEVAGGLLSNSIALLSDALHNLGDAVAVLLAYVANRVSKKLPTSRSTFGLKRVEILAALFNAVVIIVITFYLFREAYLRFLHPEPIKGLIMFIVATIGLLANIYAVLLLKSDAKSNLNVKAAYLHLLGDTISSVAVIIGSILIYFFEIYWIDPVLTVLIGLYILKEAYVVLKEAVNILMQRTPRHINLDTVKHALENIKGVENIHHVHTWNLTDKQIHFECHVNLKNDMAVSKTNAIRAEMEHRLHELFHIGHVTIQFEYNCCDDTSMIVTK
jgi:cobalt-zinc-cadmium efflux system protein